MNISKQQLLDDIENASRVLGMLDSLEEDQARAVTKKLLSISTDALTKYVSLSKSVLIHLWGDYDPEWETPKQRKP